MLLFTHETLGCVCVLAVLYLCGKVLRFSAGTVFLTTVRLGGGGYLRKIGALSSLLSHKITEIIDTNISVLFVQYLVHLVVSRQVIQGCGRRFIIFVTISMLSIRFKQSIPCRVIRQEVKSAENLIRLLWSFSLSAGPLTIGLMHAFNDLMPLTKIRLQQPSCFLINLVLLFAYVDTP